jgi:fructoselysine-6-P-deglycase FrlB-like protein
MTIQDHIGEQPAVIAAAFGSVAARLKDLRPAAPAVLVGSGSSFNALTAAAATTSRASGERPRVQGPASFLRETGEGAKSGGSVIVLSQSGASSTSVAAARAAGRTTNLLVITCEAESPIARLPLPRLILPIGGEPIGPKTKGFTVTLAGALAILAYCEGRSLPPFDQAAFAALITEAESGAGSLATTLDDLDYLVVAGDQRFYGIALEASLKVAEIAGLPTAAFETEELLHGRLHGLGPKSLVVVIASTDTEREVAEIAAAAMAKRAVRLLLLNMTGRSTRYDWMTLALRDQGVLDILYAVVPFQWLAVHLALRRGMRPETMRYPGLSADLAIKLKAD